MPGIITISRTLAAVACVFAVAGIGGARGEDIVLSMSAAFKGPSRALGIECYRGASAYFEKVNRQGGIRGRKIAILAENDGYDPYETLKNTDKFMRDPRVLAHFSFVGTPTATRVLPLLKRYESKDWRLFFPFTGADVLRQPPYDAFVYNLRPSYRDETRELVERFVKIGRKRIAVFYQIDVYGRAGWDGVRRALQDPHGLSIVGEATYRRGQSIESSMSDHVALLRASKPDAIIAVGSYGACAAFIRDTRDAGWDVPIANLSFVASEQMLKLLEKRRVETGADYTRNLIHSQVVPSYDESSTLPAVREYREAMDAIKPPRPAVADLDYELLHYSFVGFEGFLNAKVMAKILDLARDELAAANVPAARKAVVRAADRLTDFDLGLGSEVRITFRPGRHEGLRKVYFTVIQDGKFVTLPDENWKTWQP